MPIELIEKILSDKAVTANTRIGLEGGEFLLHREHGEILELFVQEHPSFDLLSNCMLPEKLIESANRFLLPLQSHKNPARLFLSLDGPPSSHDNLRGISGTYAHVLRTIEALHNLISISVMFTLTPFNTLADLEHVIGICERYRLDLRIGIYNNMQYFETKVSSSDPDSSLNYVISNIPEAVRKFDENYDFMLLYHHYRRGDLLLPCNSIKDSIVVYPNGDVPLCQNKEIILGNLERETLSEIINKKETRKLHAQFNKCNDCWINFHRKYDIVLYRNLERIFGKRLVELALGRYHWCNDKMKTYKSTIKNY